MKRKKLLYLLILLLSTPSIATTIFMDEFSDGNISGWDFYGDNYNDWSAVSGGLNHNALNGYNGKVEFALINGITTPEKFTLEADVSITSSNRTGDWGHVGFVWGVNDLLEPFDSFNTSYIRTHQDRITNWSKLNGNLPNEHFLNTSGLTNGIIYHLSVSVDYSARIMIVSTGNNTTTFSGEIFDSINQNTGGGIGLISWNDNIIFDNVVLSIPSSNDEKPTLTGVCTGTGTNTNECIATYNADGTLNIPCVSVPNAFGGTTIYEADMAIIPLSSPLSFELIDARIK